MENHQTDPPSIWIMDSVPTPMFPRLGGNLTVDVAVIGGGITGLTTALLLKRGGKRVAVIDALHVGRGATGHSPGYLSVIPHACYSGLVAGFGEESAAQVARSNIAAIDRVEKFVREERMECGFRRVPGHIYSESPDAEERLRDEAAAERAAGLRTELLESRTGSRDLRPALRIEGQAQLNPIQYALHLARAVRGEGSYVFEMTRITGITEGAPARIMIDGGGIITADAVVIAAHTPTNLNLIRAEVRPYRSRIVAARLNSAPPQGLFRDMEEPYHYGCSYPMNGRTTLIAGETDHGAEEEEDSGAQYVRLENHIRKRYDVAGIECRWSTRIYVPADGLPYIGRSPLIPGIYIATGYSGNGLTLGSLAGMIISDQILGVTNPWSEIYSPRRFTPTIPVPNVKVEKPEQRYIEQGSVNTDGAAHDRRPGDKRSTD